MITSIITHDVESVRGNSNDPSSCGAHTVGIDDKSGEASVMDRCGVSRARPVVRTDG